MLWRLRQLTKQSRYKIHDDYYENDDEDDGRKTRRRFVRADRNKSREEMMKNRRTIETNLYPFTFNTNNEGVDEDGKSYILFNDHYCFYVKRQNGDVRKAVSDFNAWFHRAKFEHPLIECAQERLKLIGATMTHHDSATAFNYFFIVNKFTCGGFVLGKDRECVTFLYYRSPAVETQGITVEPMLYSVLEQSKQGVTVTISDEFENDFGEFKRVLSSAVKVTETNIVYEVPRDKHMYATVVCKLVSAATCTPEDEYLG